MTSHRILAATDFSRTAQLAVARAARLAAAADARLDVVHVARPLSRSLLAWLRSEPTATEALDAAQERLDAAVASARKLGADARGHLVHGAPVEALEASCRRLRSDLVVLGARGARGFRDQLIGTTAERLIERLPCDVLAVRKPARATYRMVLACVDASPAAAQALRRALALAPDAEVHALHAFEPPLADLLRSSRLHALAADHVATERRRAREALVEFLRDAGVDADRVKLSLKTGYPPHVIERAVSRIAPDLIAIGHHTSPLAEPFLGSVAKHVLRIDACDVLVTRR